MYSKYCRAIAFAYLNNDVVYMATCKRLQASQKRRKIVILGSEAENQQGKKPKNRKEVAKMYKYKPMGKLASMRTDKMYTQTQLAKRCGLKKATISQYERGLRRPSITILSTIAKVLNCKIEDLIEE